MSEEAQTQNGVHGAAYCWLMRLRLIPATLWHGVGHHQHDLVLSRGTLTTIPQPPADGQAAGCNLAPEGCFNMRSPRWKCHNRGNLSLYLRKREAATDIPRLGLAKVTCYQQTLQRAGHRGVEEPPERRIA